MGDTPINAATMLASAFATLPDLIAAHAREQGSKTALILGDARMTYAELDRGMDRVAAALQRDGVAAGSAVEVLTSERLGDLFGVRFAAVPGHPVGIAVERLDR